MAINREQLVAVMARVEGESGLFFDLFHTLRRENSEEVFEFLFDIGTSPRMHGWRASDVAGKLPL